jgi:hypothetical protein
MTLQAATQDEQQQISQRRSVASDASMSDWMDTLPSETMPTDSQALITTRDRRNTTEQ